MGKQISAIDIKRLWYGDTNLVTSALKTKATVETLIGGLTEVKNVHQDTWTIDEAESSQDSYKNQLTGATYRMGAKTMGDVSFNFTIGRYDFKTKADLMGGTADDAHWERKRGVVELRHVLVALTEDDVYCILPFANVNTREANTDGAVGLAVVATMMEPENEEIAPEYWVDATGSVYATGKVGTI